MDIRKRVAWNLRKIRVSQGLSQEVLAVDAGVDRTYVSRLERNLENPTVLVLERLAQALNVEIVEFFQKPDGKILPVLKSGRKRSRNMG